MARMYANENFPMPVVEELRRLGHAVLTTYESGQAGQAIPDEQVLAFAKKEGRILLTINRKHFKRLHATASNHSGIVACTFDANISALAQRIHVALLEQPEMARQFIRINRPG